MKTKKVTLLRFYHSRRRNSAAVKSLFLWMGGFLLVWGIPHPIGAASLPPPGKTLVLIGQEHLAEYQSYVSGTGVAPAGPSYYWTFETSSLNGADPPLVQYQNATYPCAYAELAVDWKGQPPNSDYDLVTFENQIVAGTYDANIDAIAQFVKTLPLTTFLIRVEYEVTPDVEANSDPTAYDDPTDFTAYPKAFHYIRNRLLNVDGVTNALFVYHPQINYTASLYPNVSPTDVDLVGYSVWNGEFGMPTSVWNAQPVTTDSNGMTLTTYLLGDLNWLAANHPQVPLMICESAGVLPGIQSTVGFVEFLDRYFNFIEAYNLRAFVYINSDWPAWGWTPAYGDSRVETTTYPGTDAVSVKGYWLQRISNNRYIEYTPCPGTGIPTATPFPVSTVTGSPTTTPTPPTPGSSPTAVSSPSSGSYVYPDPVRGGQASLHYNMAGPGQMNLRIYNLTGELVATLNQTQPAGPQDSQLNLQNIAQGVYFYVVQIQYDSGQWDNQPAHKFIVLK